MAVFAGFLFFAVLKKGKLESVNTILDHLTQENPQDRPGITSGIASRLAPGYVVITYK